MTSTADPAESAGTPAPTRGVLGRLRAIAVLLLVCAGVLGAAATPAAIWARNLLVDSDTYVRTVEPLATDPAIQQAVIAAVEGRIAPRLDLRPLIERTFPRATFLAAPLQQAAVGAVHRAVTELVTSNTFDSLWTGINRTAHRQLAGLLTDRPVAGGTVVLDQERLVLDLAPVVEAAKDRLVAAGLTAAAAIPSAGATLDIAYVPRLAALRDVTSTLDRWADVLPWLALGLLLAAVVVARRRRRTVIIVALAVSGAMVVVGLALLAGRGLLLSHLPAQVPEAAAGVLFDALVLDLQTDIRIGAIVGLAVAVLAVLAGPRARSLARRTLSAVVRPLTRLQHTPAGTFVAHHRRRLWLAVVFGGAFVLVLWNRPTTTVAVWISVVAILLLGAVEIVRPREPTPEHESITDRGVAEPTSSQGTSR